MEHKAETKRKAIPRKVAEQKWKDPTLADWLENYADDYRLFCGDLGNEVNDDVLSRAFSRFPSFNMAKIYKVSTAKLGWERTFWKNMQCRKI
ncbi:RNA-binding protein 42-like isoform X3 [Benincasa hispida]|uniref:RNA-binding protein 42-like isoform X3 n=1 Tax=Benincasa hispida TaxID=102211 RepID=UPI00190274B9|nr:RNA-binding protein 42-like isoform X3 [Benincasa hispida]